MNRTNSIQITLDDLRKQGLLGPNETVSSVKIDADGTITCLVSERKKPRGAVKEQPKKKAAPKKAVKKAAAKTSTPKKRAAKRKNATAAQIEKFLAKKVSGIGLPKIAENTLVAGGINTVAELLQKTGDELLKIPKFGKKSLTDVKKTLAYHKQKLQRKKTSAASK